MSDRERLPHANRILPDQFRLMHEMTKTDAYLSMTDRQFVAEGMRLARGKTNPLYLSAQYYTLMEDAGLEPLIDAQEEG